MNDGAARYIRIPTHLGDVDVMRACFFDQVFPRHYHEGYGLGCITSGAMEFRYRGEKLIASAGSINSVNPDEPHDGQAFDERGWSYGMLYFGEDVFINLHREITGKESTPYLLKGVMQDKSLALSIQKYIDSIASAEIVALESETRLLEILFNVLSRHTDKRPTCAKTYKLGGKIEKIKSYVRDHISDNLTIKELADVAGVSSYHFIRSFRYDTGVAPYEYVAQTRASLAKELLLNGVRPVDVSLMAGYSDQSHMNRWLKRMYGITPRNLSKLA